MLAPKNQSPFHPLQFVRQRTVSRVEIVDSIQNMRTKGVNVVRITRRQSGHSCQYQATEQMVVISVCKD